MEERGENPTQKDTLKHDIVTGMGSLSLALSLGRYCLFSICLDFMHIHNLKKGTYFPKFPVYINVYPPADFTSKAF